MSRLTRSILLLGAALVPAVAATACKTVDDVACPLMKCGFEGDQGVRITLVNAVERMKADLPVTITLCAEDKCTDAELRLEGTSFACSSKDIRAECKVRDDGGLEIGYAVELPEKDEVSVHVTVKNEAGDTVYEETKPVLIDERKPSDLDCPQVCREAEVVLSPPAVGQ
jgi:hypothetical protein